MGSVETNDNRSIKIPMDAFSVLSMDSAGTTEHRQLRSNSLGRTFMKRTMLVVVFGLVGAMLITSLVFILFNFEVTIKLKSEQYSQNQLNQSRDDEEIKVCESAVCANQSAAMISIMNLSVNPCMDFYQYACGRMDRNPSLELIKSGGKNVSHLEDNVLFDLQKILEQPVESLGNEAEKIAQCYYQSCLKTDGQTKDPGKLLLDQLDQIGKWRVIDQMRTLSFYPGMPNPMMVISNFQNVFQTVHNVLHVDSFFRWTVEPALPIKGNLNNPERHIIKLDVSPLSLINNSIYLEHDKKITLNMLETLMTEVLASIWTNYIDTVKSNFQMAAVINQVVNDIMEVESRIAQLTPLLDTQYDVETYEYVTIAELNTLAPFIDWNKFFQSAFSQVNITITPSQTVLVTSTTFLRGVSIFVTELLKDYKGQEKLKNYLCWCTANRYLQILKKSYWKKPKREANIGNYCIAETTNTMPLVVTAMRVQRSFTNELSKLLVENMTKSVKEAFKENLINLDWLDQETREVLDDKVEAMSSLIGDSELILKSIKLINNFSNLKFDSANFYLNNIHLESYSFYEKLMKLEHPVDKKWAGPTFRVIHSYPRYEDSFFFTSTNLVLHKPNFKATTPHALHFGSIGASFGRALGQINFDSRDRLQPAFRSKNLRQLSRIASMQGFEKRSSCLIHQYSNYTSNSLNRHPADEKLTLDENIADNGGLKAAYNAFRKWKTTHEEVVLPLPGVNMTHTQLFFLSFAQSWCENWPYRDKQVGGVTRSSEYSPARYRVVGTLFNMREFSEAFQCPLGSLMNPKAKCEIW